MKHWILAAAVVGGFGAPALAADAMVTCGDYSIMDNAAQMETIAAIETETSDMAKADSLTPDAIHEKLAADCKDKVDVLVIDVVKGYM
jgi:hypothetical protein